MGQYYKPIILGEDKKTVKAFMYSHDYNNGLKLTEHSWIGNDFVAAFENLIRNNPKNVVWAGDYAKKDGGQKRGQTLYSKGIDELKIKPTKKVNTIDSRYIVNHTKKEFVDKYKAPKSTFGWKIHPLPLLTCEGNGEGGGDYHSDKGANHVGTWARNLISVERKKPQGYKEIIPNFAE